VDVDVEMEDCSNVHVENFLGQEVVEDGPKIFNTSLQTVKGVGVRRKTRSNNLTLSHNSSNQKNVCKVYNDWPRCVYNKLVKGHNGTS
jgi:hypothetical protein